MNECTECAYFIRYPHKQMTCLMKQEFCIINGNLPIRKIVNISKVKMND